MLYNQESNDIKAISNRILNVTGLVINVLLVYLSEDPNYKKSYMNNPRGTLDIMNSSQLQNASLDWEETMDGLIFYNNNGLRISTGITNTFGLARIVPLGTIDVSEKTKTINLMAMSSNYDTNVQVNILVNEYLWLYLEVDAKDIKIDYLINQDNNLECDIYIPVNKFKSQAVNSNTYLTLKVEYNPVEPITRTGKYALELQLLQDIKCLYKKIKESTNEAY